MNRKLLTIAIPTYNRSRYLNQCLAQVCKQIPAFETEIELLVSNNCSTDDTEDIVFHYRAKGVSIIYTKNDENIGADKNIAQCFTMASAKYVLVLGDDDLLLDDSLKTIMEVLQKGDFGIVYINAFGFIDNYVSEKPYNGNVRTIIYTDSLDYIRRVNYWITFLSSNIVNKSILSEKFNPYIFDGTNLIQLSWVISALLASEKNAVINDYCIAARAENTSGYKLCEVFAKNFKNIMEYFIKRPEDKIIFSIIENNLLLTFFPRVITSLKSGKSGYSFSGENFHQELSKYYGDNKYYWIFTFPIIILPGKLASIELKFNNLINRIVNGKHR